MSLQITPNSITANLITDSTTIGQNLVKLPNPGAITFPRFDAANTVTALNAVDFRTAIGAGTSSTVGTVTAVNNGNGMNFTNITASGTVTLGTPSTCTAATTNDVTTSSHTHAITGFAPSDHAHVAYDITGGVFGNSGQIGLANHPEGGGLLTPSFDNDLAFITQKGGSVAFYYTDSVEYTEQTLNNLGSVGFSTTVPFNGTPSYTGTSISSTSSVVICDITMPFGLSYGNTFYIDFGNASWMAKNVSFYAYQTSGNAETVYKLVGSAFVNNTQHLKFTYGSYSHTLTAGGTGYTYNRLRLVLTNWQGTSPRIATIGARYYSSVGLATTLLSVGGGTIYGNLGITGTVDGRDISADGSKLDGIATGATANTGTVTSVTAGNGMTQSGTSTINPTLDIVSHAGSAGTIGTINVGVDAIGVNLGTTSTTAYPGNNPSGFTTNTGTVTSVGGTGTVSGLTLSGTVTTTGNLTLGGTLSLTSGNVTTALGFTPYNATNPSGYITNGSAAYFGISNSTATNGYGISLYGGAVVGQPTYGLMFQGTATFGTYGGVTADWATYFTMNNTAGRGWIFKTSTGTAGNVASISVAGAATFASTIAASNFSGSHSGTSSGTNTGDNPGVTSVATSGGYGGLTLTGGTITSTGTITMGGTPTGTWPISVSGNAATVTNGVYTTGTTMTGDLTWGTSDRDNSPIGTYDPSKTQQIWSMGAAYKNSATGVNFGTLYGAAYKHTNNVTGGTMAAGHQMVWCQNGVGTAALGTDIWTSGNVTAYSDIRVKKNIVKIHDALSKVCQLSGYTFERTDGVKLEDGSDSVPLRQTGVIAQEVLKVLPEAVTGSEETHYSVAYGNMVGLLIEAIKEQQIIIESQETRISRLEALINTLID